MWLPTPPSAHHLLLLLAAAGAPTGAEAQFGDFFRNMFGGGSKAALQDAAARAYSHELTAANWVDIINATTITTPAAAAAAGGTMVPRSGREKKEGAETEEEQEEAEEAAVHVEEWMLYFTASEDVKTKRNVTMWDAIYEDALLKLSASKRNIHFGRVDYSSSSESHELCRKFLVTEQTIPTIYHAAQFPHNGSILLRPYVGTWGNTTVAEKTEHLVRFFAEQEWRGVKPWTGLFNPVDGALKAAGPYVGMLKGWYELVPQWLLMLAISVLGRQVTTKVVNRSTQRPRNSPPTAT